MGKHWWYFLFMLWLTYLIVSSVLLFARGFLLSRVTQESNATCLSFAEVPCAAKESTIVNITNGNEEQCSKSDKLAHALRNMNSASSICLPQKSRIILLIIDALRYDFTEFDEKLSNPRPYQNRLPVIKNAMKAHPEHSRLFKFIADPPTTTMQRLKALTTGSLPTFIDAGSNFASSEIGEDNIIDQLLRNNLSAVFMGDDTWNGLYPDRFLRKYPFPSFNVWDLDTVDNGIRGHLQEELKKTDWSLLVAHFLGVDHCGHRYGPNHPEMTRKLTEMNDVIGKVIDTLDQDTMLFVIGDHGMTSTGDHGGESEDEVTSAFFVHSKRPLSPFGGETKSLKQISLVPTMATILGVSIPFSNLGSLVLNVLPATNTSYVEEWQVAMFSLWANVQQMMDYIDEYAKNTPNTFGEESVRNLNERFAVLNSRSRRIDGEEEFKVFAKECETFLEELRQLCEKVWVQFDSFAMTRGLLFLFLSMFSTYTIVDGIPRTHLPEIFMSSFITCSYLVNFLAACLAAVLHHFGYVADLMSTVFFFTGMASQFMLVILIIQNWEVISLSWYDRSRKERLPNLICRLVLVFNLCGLFSNSFIVEESFVLLFLLNTVIFVGTMSVAQTEGTVKKKKQATPTYQPKFKLLLTALGVLALVRLSMYFWRCREEQQWCFETFHGISSVTAKLETTRVQWAATVVCVALFVTATKEWLRNCGNLSGYSITVTLARYAPTVATVCASGFWVLNRLPSESRERATKPWQANVMAWIVYGMCCLGIITTILRPLCVYVLPPRNQLPRQSDNPNVIPQLFRRLKELFNKEGTEDVPVVCGLYTAYSSVFVIIGVYITLLMALVHGDAIAPSTVIMFVCAAFVLMVTSIIRLEKAESIDDLLEIPNASLLVWVIMAQYFFYGTGHQPTFPNIQWEAAFVGTDGLFSSNLIPASLVIFNTFSSYLLMGFLLPLLIIVPFSISVMIPWAVKRSVLQKYNIQGEVMLFERDEAMITTAFTTSCKYMMGHGIRVFASMLAATIHCRHLMVWSIFAPKLIFEGLGLFATLFAVNASFLLLVRINTKVEKLVLDINKKWS